MRYAIQCTSLGKKEERDCEFCAHICKFIEVQRQTARFAQEVFLQIRRLLQGIGSYAYNI